jgi:N-acetylneuraminic acid mutarotase
LLLGFATGCGARTGLPIGGARDGTDDSGIPPDRAQAVDDGGSCLAEQCVGAAAGRMVLFGGLSEISGAYLSETWEWDGSAWTQRGISGPSPRYGAAMAALRSKVVLFGGIGTAYPSDTWEWDGTVWAQDNVLGPDGREGHAMATLGSKVVLFGGAGGAGAPHGLADTWEWDGTAWAQRTVAGPGARQGHAMATLGSKVVLFGGAASVPNAPPTYLGDTWEWDGARWTARSVVGPSGRDGHAMASLDGKVVLFGGWDGRSLGSDTWEWDGNVWTQRHVAGPRGRELHSMATVHSKVVLFGGTSGNPDLLQTDTWEWDGNTWTQRAASGPSARQSAAAASR